MAQRCGRRRSSENERRDDQHHPAKRDRDALYANRHAKQVIEASNDPVAQHGLVDARLVVEHRIDVVATLHHFARRLDIERLVRIPDGRAAKIDEIRTDGEKEHQPMLNAEC